jgi:hypothetical protein
VIAVGDTVRHPDDGRKGVVLDVITNPACLMRYLVVRWENGETEELEEWRFGQLDGMREGDG